MRRSGVVYVAGVLLAAGLSLPAAAQVCIETNGTGADKVNESCDLQYRDSEITCDTAAGAFTKGTAPSCPKKPMPMIETPQMSYIADYAPQLYIFPKDKGSNDRPYSGAYAVGTPGDATRTFQLIGNSAEDTNRLAGCTTQIKAPKNPANDRELAQLIRLQLDNCTNQYILNTAMGSMQKEMPNRALSMENPDNPEERISLQTHCQPLNMMQDSSNEYDPATYLSVAWEKMLDKPGKRKTTPSYLRCMPAMANTATDLLSDGTYGVPYDREPHLPCTNSIPGKPIKLDNPIPTPTIPAMKLSEISATTYEEILDPTHPFSPRWDFVLSDRDYGNPSLNWASLGNSASAAAKAAVIYGLHQYYMQDTKNTIFCAGVKEAKNENGRAKADKEVKVDVLEFRRSKFDNALLRRTAFNWACFNHRAQFTSGGDPYVLVFPASFCNIITGYSIHPPYVFGRDFDCWECFGLNGKIKDEQQPPCATNYLGKDLYVHHTPGGLNFFKFQANCGDEMGPVCADLRKPFTPLNKLKMRYHNPFDENDKDGKNLVLKSDVPLIKDGALEGLAFRDYFGNHMPYPRMWDLGHSLQKTPNNNSNDQPPMDTTGQYTAIVGVGREAAAWNAADHAPQIDGKRRDEVFTDQRCKTMGWGSSLQNMAVNQSQALTGIDRSMGFSTFAGIRVDWPDPVSSWTEMKLYQARTHRHFGLSCIGRYEKTFKPGSAENMMLLASGAPWDQIVIEKCDNAGSGRPANCKPMTLKQYTDEGKPANDDAKLFLKGNKAVPIPLSWRGYAASLTVNNKFPMWGQSIAPLYTGLSNAQVGDIVYMPLGHNNSVSSDYKGLAKLALVVQVNLPSNSNCEADKNCFIKVLEPDNGKWPDVCGTTDTWGQMVARFYFKPGHLPQEAIDEYTSLGLSSSSCAETRISQCEMPYWDSMFLYRISEDERKGCKDNVNASECKP